MIVKEDVIQNNHIDDALFNNDYDKVPQQIPEEYEDLSNEEAAIKYGIK